MSDNTAILAGFTKEIEFSLGPHDMHCFIHPDAEIDDRFKAYDADACEWIMVNGWHVTDLCVIENNPNT